MSYEKPKRTNTDPRLEPKQKLNRHMAPRGSIGHSAPAPAPAIGPYYLMPAPYPSGFDAQNRSHQAERIALHQKTRDRFHGHYNGPTIAKNDFDQSR